ncbi:MAG TPA: bifunctional riboflavin kinase/FAD synthetase [Woeseiaceae bacterium]|nr:bifunctional riboflavin kinase/FAD synthetase [Woeseiaceae bacterium]
MKLVRHLCDMPCNEMREGSVVTIGSFDGVHLGHQELLQRVIATAHSQSLRSVVMSFEPTPKEFFQAERPPARLMRFREKFEALADHGIDIFYCPRFNASMREISAADFIRRILVHGLNARVMIVGDDFRFASRREGNLEMLRKSGKALDFSVAQVESIRIAGLRVSSTAIREALRAGDMALASALLGRPYQMSGKVVRGAGLGRKLGFPTANVDLRRRQSAVNGIFAARVHGLQGGPHDGVASVGSRPTFGGLKPLLEVYLFDFERDIYGKHIQVDFIAQLRRQKKYDDVDALVAQMHQDADNAREILRRSSA